MRPATRLLHACRITLFTRSNCSLCDNAKLVLSKVWHRRPFDYVEVPVMEPGHQKWQIYQFDTPVVSGQQDENTMIALGTLLTEQIHVDKSSRLETTTAARKLMHRFNEDQVLQLLDDVAKPS